MDAQQKVDDIIAEFSELEPYERLELLSEYSRRPLPQLPERLKIERDAGQHRITECQSSMFIWVELQSGKVQIFAEADPQAPSPKAFVSLLINAFNGQPPEAILATPPDLLSRLGLLESLGMIRMRGLAAIQHYIRQQVSKAAA
ncbi:MAG TPA: SufE family protein [Pirellulales bacterium]